MGVDSSLALNQDTHPWKAIVDAVDKTRYFILGCPDITIITDHKPLVKLFGDISLADIANPRLLRLKERSHRYRFKILHIPGIRNKTEDAISRHPVGAPGMNDAAPSLNTTRAGREYRHTSQWPLRIDPGLLFQNPQARLDGKNLGLFWN